jgi:hypothetical protein
MSPSTEMAQTWVSETDNDCCFIATTPIVAEPLFSPLAALISAVPRPTAVITPS